jgi:branched-chain amino acid transport system substrate-binding protein
MIARRKLLLAAATTAALAQAAVAPGGARAADAGPVRVGDINSYTRMAAFTEPYRKGMQLAWSRRTRAAARAAG